MSPSCSCLILQDFYRNFSNDPKVKIPWVRRDLSGPRVLTMEWIDGIRCTDPAAIRASGMDVAEFIRCGVVTGLRQLLEVFLPSAEFCFLVSLLWRDVVQSICFGVCHKLLQVHLLVIFNSTPCSMCKLPCLARFGNVLFAGCCHLP